MWENKKAIKKAEHRRIDAFELWRWRRLLRVPWTARRSNQFILKEISPGCSLEGLMLKLKLPIFWPPDAESWLIWKHPDVGKDWRQEEKGTTEDEKVGWHHQLDGCGFGWTLGVGDGQRGLACCGSWGRKESDTTERLNWTELSLLFGTQGRSRRLKPFPVNKKQGTQRSFWTQEGSSGSCSVSVPPFLWYFSIMGVT